MGGYFDGLCKLNPSLPSYLIHRSQPERYGRLLDEEGLPQRLAIFYVAHGRLVELAELPREDSGRILNS